MTTENGYNGWKNYETWCIKLWLDNDQGEQEYMMELTRDNLDDAHDLANVIKDYIEENMPEIANSVYLDLLQSAINNADFREIAESYISDYNEENPE